LAAFEILDEGMTEDAVPSIEIGQLLRSFAQGGEEGGDTGERPARPVPLTVRAADRHSGASGMVTTVRGSAPSRMPNISMSQKVANPPASARRDGQSGASGLRRLLKLNAKKPARGVRQALPYFAFMILFYSW